MVHKRMGKTRCSPFPLRPPPTRLSPTLQRTPKVVQDTMHHQQLQRSRQKQCLIDFYSKPSRKKRYREGKQGRQSRILQPTFPSSQTRKPVETRDRPQFSKSVSHGLKIQNGNPRIHSRITKARGMGYLYRPFGCLPSSSHPSTIKEIPEVPPPREFLPIHQLAVRASHSPTGAHVPGKGGQTVGTKTRHPVAPIPGQLADQSTFPGRIKETYCQPPFPDPITGLHSKSPEVGTSTPTEVQIHRVPFFTRSGSCQAHGRQMGQNSELLQQDLKEVCYQCKDSYVHHWIASIRREDSKTGQDPYETFSMASKDSLEIPNASEFSHSLDSDNETTRGMVVRPTTHIKRRILTPQGPRRSDLYRRIKHRLGRTLRSRLRRRLMVKQLHINVLELKAVILALKHFSDQCTKKQVLVASDNTTVVAHINKQGGTHSPELCALMWQLLTWCNKYQMLLRARHVPGSLNVIADGLSRRNQIQHTKWSLSPQIFKQIAQLWEHPQIDLFATKLNTKLPTYVSPIPDPQAWAVDALNISWKNIVGYAFPPTALLPRVVQKLLSQSCRLILIAPGWPTKPWFWDLVDLSLDHPRQLPPIRSLLKQPLNNQFHTHPESLNLHAWFLGVQSSRTRASLQKWQIELQHLKDSLLEPSMHRNGQYFKDGAPTNRWTSGLPL